MTIAQGGFLSTGPSAQQETDRAAVRALSTDLSDISPESQSRIQSGFRQAYEAARLVRVGLKDPMSR